MKHSRLACLLVSTFLAAPAFAASVTMLQFGSFESREEAEKRLAEVKGKYATEIGALEAGVREIKLPPDNLVVYRTVVGPVENRAAAQGICAKFKTTGDECYIVQTAMMKPAAAPVVAAARAEVSEKPATALLPEPMKQSEPEKTALVPAEPAAEQTTEPSLMRNLSVLNDVPARDPSNQAALMSVRTDAEPAKTMAAEAPVAAVVPLPSVAEVEAHPLVSASMQQALDEAAAKQEAAAASVDGAVTTIEEKRPARSFWSRLNPFSDDEAEMPLAKLDDAEKTEAKAEVVEVKEVPVPVAEAPPASPPAPMVEEPAAPVAVAEVKAPEPVAAPVSAPPVVGSSPKHLPPPPPPLREEDRQMLLAIQRAPKAPRQEAPLSTGEIAPLSGLPEATSGDVQVEEAQRVPVTQPVAAPPVSFKHSRDTEKQTVWGQLGPFTNDQAALSFWDRYRQEHPDFPVVRVRVTSPYQLKQAKMSSQVWLRVGPMQHEGFVRNLCGSVKLPKGAYCGRVMDMGIASDAKRVVDGLK